MPAAAPSIERDAPVRTWFGVGGRADRLCRPASVAELAACAREEPTVLVLGAGANLLVADGGVRELVVELTAPCFREVSIDRASGRVEAGAGVSLPALIGTTVAAGLGGLETLAGIPATVGGAVRMNAGGRFGEIGALVGTVRALDPRGDVVELDADRLAFGYRRSELGGYIVTGVTLRLEPADPAALRARLSEISAYKASTQPLGRGSPGCCFKNPTLAEAIGGVGAAGDRVPAGLLIDRAGCKGMRSGSAEVSERHANFIRVAPGGRAADVLALMAEVGRRVYDEFGVTLERELVVWGEP